MLDGTPLRCVPDYKPNLTMSSYRDRAGKRQVQVGKLRPLKKGGSDTCSPLNLAEGGFLGPSERLLLAQLI